MASIGLLLALALEACGCNPVSGLNIDSFNNGHAGQEIAPAEQVLSFYDPVDQTPSQTSYQTPKQTAPSTAASLFAFSTPAPSLRPLPLETKSVPWAIPESVYLIYRSRSPGELAPRQPPLATAFVLSVPAPGRNPDRLIRFLVTARHVVDPRWARCSDGNPSSIDLRLNRRVGGVGYETVPLLTGTAPRFFTPSDPNADLAVIPLDSALIAHLDDYKFLDVPFRLLLSTYEMPLLHLEQPVMTVGLSTLPTEEPASFPVFGAGSLSKMPAEAVGVRCGHSPSQSKAQQTPPKLIHVWFINAGVPPSFSGAPVFTSIARGSGTAETPVLLGVQSVVWPDKGITGITPSPVLGDLIRSVLRQTNGHLDLSSSTTHHLKE